MSGISRSGKDYTGYDYKELTVDSGQVSAYVDGYENFGWEIDENRTGSRGGTPFREQAGGAGGKKTVICLKRDRKIMNKAELTRLQKHFEDCMNQIEALERAKTGRATVAALCVGVAGTAFMACSVFAITAEHPAVLLSTLLAVPAFVGWILPCFIYRGMVRRKTEQILPLIEEKRDELYEICEKGHKLLV